MEDAKPPSPTPEVGKITIAELFSSLSAGWCDFKTAPAFGIFFSAFYVLGGMALVGLGAGTVVWTLAVSLGFPLVGPFAAVGLYEVSRRLEADEPLIWSNVLGVVVAERHRQIPWIGAIVVIYFLIWTLLAHLIFALLLGPSASLSVSNLLGIVTTKQGLILIAVELGLGAILSFFLFSITVMSLPLLLEKEIDFVTAMILSVRTVTSNLFVMFIWAAILAILMFAAMLPFFIGLFIVLPILGHATWHLYRRALYDPV